MNRRLIGRSVVAALLAASIGLAAPSPAAAQATAPGAPTVTPAVPAPATPAPQAVAPTATPATGTPAQVPTQAPASPQPPAGAGQTPAAQAPAAQAPGATPDAKQPDGKSPDTKTPDGKALAPEGPRNDTEIEPHAAPGIPDNATTETVMVPARSLVMITGQSSYDDAFKSIKTSLLAVKAAMDKAGLQPTGHPITIFSEPDDKGFKYIAAIPIAAAPSPAPDLGKGVTIGTSPAGKAIKFQHRGAYDDIDSTYDVITAYLDAKGMQVDNPYIEEYLTDLSDGADPNLQVDIYVFVKK